MSKSIIEELSEERKHLQEIGELPEWYTTPGWQLFKEKYVFDGQNVKAAYQRIAEAAAVHMFGKELYWEEKFFEIMWNGWLAPSTPVMANMGTSRACPVACAGSYVSDSIAGFYSNQLETAILSKNGFGTSGYLGDIRPRGSDISIGGFASGILPVLKDFVQLSRDVSQGATRRGAWAGYIEIDHDDFWEIITFLENNPDDCNIGWNISNAFIDRLDNGDKDAIARYQRTLKVKMISGKGYYLLIDKVNEQNPECYKVNQLDVKASNLCLTGDTKIKIRNKELPEFETTLKEYIDVYSKSNINFEILSYNIDNKIPEWKKITDSAMINPKAKLIKITDHNTGKYIKCTLEHKIFTSNRGYVMAKNLKESDELVIN